MEFFNAPAWRQAARHPDWYLRIEREYQALLERAKAQPAQAEPIKEALRSFFEELLTNDELAPGGSYLPHDAEREPISYAVIHHSNREPGYYTLARLNAVHLLNLYLPAYTRPGELRGLPLSSNHYRDGKMVFYGYHWWVEADGTPLKLLPDEAIGWHANNWGVNCRSIGICINEDLTKKAPTSAAIQAVRRILQRYDHAGQPLTVVGHREASHTPTVCPGDTFLNGWKASLLTP